MKEIKEIIKQFESKEAKKYWINALDVSNSVKGKLYIYFNLI